MPDAIPDDPQIEVSAVRGEGDMIDVFVYRDFYELQIYFGGLLHLHIDNSKLLGMQAWKDNEHSFTIEYTLAGGTMQTQYTTEEKWKAVLAGLEKVL